MSDFRTKIKLPQYHFSINHQHRLLSIGSCFAENIGHQLTALKFKNNVNPFGILFNPISIINNLTRLFDNDNFQEDELFENNGLWHSFAHHSVFSKIEKVAALEGIQNDFQQARIDFKNCQRLIFTFGTAHVFEAIKTNKVVANCHKMPSTSFRHRRLSVLEIVEIYLPFLEKIKSQNTDLQIIMTVSPVRHIRDGLVGNQKSKAVLQLAIDEIVQQLDFVHYFPAYEIMMDDLRDYRFYEADLIHPNQVAIDYIWKQFQHSFFDENTQQLNQKIEKIKAAAQHRSFHPQSIAHQQFLKKQLEKVENLAKEYPFLDLTEEHAVFEQQIF